MGVSPDGACHPLIDIEPHRKVSHNFNYAFRSMRLSHASLHAPRSLSSSELSGLLEDHPAIASGGGIVTKRKRKEQIQKWAANLLHGRHGFVEYTLRREHRCILDKDSRLRAGIR